MRLNPTGRPTDNPFFLRKVFSRPDYANEIIYFPDNRDALDYVNHSEIKPFVIKSNIWMPERKDYRLRNKIPIAAQSVMKASLTFFNRVFVINQ